ncbi:MAG: LUD domain-containing protein [Acidobacteriaceae bacterium]
MADARREVLERIRGGLGDRSATPAPLEYATILRSYGRRGERDPEERLALLLERLRDYDAHVVETTAGALPQTIAAILAEHRQKTVIAADGLPAGVLPAGFAFIPECEAAIDELNRCDGIVTTCTVAIAFTGTIVLTHGPGEGARRLTLLPDRHLCIVRADQVVETVPEGFDRLAAFDKRPLTFISGPSATADIEMTRIRGVHGPRFMDAVLVR